MSKSFWIALLTLLPALVFGGGAQASEPEEHPLPRRMAALGDSMTEALFARYSFRGGISSGELWGIIATYGLSRPSQRMINIRRRYADLELSWSTGYGDDRVLSHAARIAQHVDWLEAWNFAESGASAFDLRYQADRLLEAQNRTGEGFDYLTLVIGANDLLEPNLQDVVRPEQFSHWVETALTRVLDRNPEMRVLIVGIPEIFEIFRKTAHLEVTRIWGRRILCEDLRSTVYGQAIAFDARHPHFFQVREIFEAYQRELERLTLTLNFEYPQARIKLLPNFQTQEDVADVVSIDCFHPSFYGQAELAELTWEAGFWGHLD